MMIYALRAADPDRAAAIARRGRPAKSHGFSDLDTGKIVQDIKVFDVANPQLEYQDMNLNTHATPPPIVEAGRVYVHYTVDHRPLLHCGVKIRSRNMVIYMAAS